MKLGDMIQTKNTNVRKTNWSAPTTMGVFILICMIIIFSFEAIGLANKEINLEHRYIKKGKSNRHLKDSYYYQLGF